MAVFEMRNARKAFGALEVLKGVSLKVEKGEVVSIIGPSGGGKSTMLRCATLLETMDSGTLAYGENVAALEENGKLAVEKLHVITFDYANHGYYVLGEKVASAFEDGKKFK